MSRRVRRISQEQATSSCAWCKRELVSDDELYSVAARVKPWVKLPTGPVLELSLDSTHPRVTAIVPAPDSPAKQAGNDLLFAVCSQECGQALREALHRQIDFSEGPGVAQ
ncbi:MAG: hypothetical protein JSV81_02725 [Anaerolineales bacterium]|nr:MAG: hypothetical protein JSV81_02725 [Anaerolineales bacterium]